MFCSQCGKELINDSKFCSYCGKNVTGTSGTNGADFSYFESEYQKSRDPNASNKSRGATAVFAFLFGAFGGIYLSVDILGLLESTLVEGEDIDAVVESIDYVQKILKLCIPCIIGGIICTVPVIWGFVDFILTLCGVVKDKDNKLVKEW